MTQKHIPPPDWRQIALNHREWHFCQAEEIAYYQQSLIAIDHVKIASQFGKILGLSPENPDTPGKPVVAVTFLESLATVIHRSAAPSPDVFRFSKAWLADTCNDIHQPASPGTLDQIEFFISFFCEVGAITQCGPNSYEVADPDILLDIIESGKVATASPAPVPPHIIADELLSLAETLADQGKTYDASLLREAARVMLDTQQRDSLQEDA